MISYGEEKHLSPPETAACLLAILCREGAVFTIDAEGLLNVDFSAVAFPVGDCDPEELLVMLKTYAQPIKDILRSDEVKH